MALIDKASLLFVPSVVAEGKAFNILPSGNRAPDSTDQNSGYDQTRADFDFDRGSNAAATRVNASGLIEKYRENVLTYSNDFSNAAWTPFNASVTSGQSGYDGSNDAWKFNESATTGEHQLKQIFTQSGVNCLSIYAKAAERDVIIFRMNLSSSWTNVFFNLTSGSVVSTGGFVDATITSVGNGWYRCEAVFTNLTGSTVQYQLGLDNTTYSYAGEAGKGIYIQSAQLESGLVATDVLTSGATTAKAGVLVDLPRINYDANGENGALLLEPSRQNLIPQTEYLNGISWSGKIGTSFDTNTTTSPEGLENSALLKEDSSNGSHFAYKDFNLTNGSTYTISIFAKSNGANRNLRFGDGGVGWSSGFNGVFNLTDGTATGGDIESMGDGWYRCSVTGTTNATTSRLIIYSTLGTATSYQGDGSSGVFLYGFQLEVGAYATSYIPNHGESGGVTRAADSCSVTGASDILNNTEGVFYVEFKTDYRESVARRFSISDGTTNNRVNIYANSDKVEGFIGGTSTTFITPLALGEFVKVAFKYKSGQNAFYVNGTKISTSTDTFTLSGLNRVGFDLTSGANLFFGDVKQLAVFNEALSDSELATLTTL